MLIESIFLNLLKSSNYFRIVYPHIDEKYFDDKEVRLVFKKIKEYYNQTNKQPKFSEIKLMIETDNSISENDTESCYKFLESIKNAEVISDEEFFIKQTEQYCQNKALENAIIESVDIIQKKNENYGVIEEKIKNALSIEFLVKIGHDYFKDVVNRYNEYTKEDVVVPCDIDVINEALGGGFRKKSIYCFMGPTNSGKTIWLCHLAATLMKQGKNVLYISAEMSEEMITKRIDANLLDIPMNDFNENLDKKLFLGKVKSYFEKTHGKLIVKEYPTGSANTNHIKNLLNEIKLKKGYMPDFIVLDYLNLFSSSRLNASAGINSYQYIKYVTEEFRGLAVQFDTTVITATQTNRGGMTATTDIDMTSTSESIGLPMTLDWMGSLIVTPELFEQNKYLLKVLKSRFMDNISKIYTLGVDRSKMRLLNLDASEQEIPIHVRDKLKYQELSKEDDSFDFS